LGAATAAFISVILTLSLLPGVGSALGGAASALGLAQQLSSALMPLKVCSEVPKMTPLGLG
tara:strand:+ start:378 stop:560 length:183 start_codon:yes stop_codon:yes gene_type:complete